MTQTLTDTADADLVVLAGLARAPRTQLIRLLETASDQLGACDELAQGELLQAVQVIQDLLHSRCGVAGLGDDPLPGAAAARD